MSWCALGWERGAYVFTLRKGAGRLAFAHLGWFTPTREQARGTCVWAAPAGVGGNRLALSRRDIPRIPGL